MLSFLFALLQGEPGLRGQDGEPGIEGAPVRKIACRYYCHNIISFYTNVRGQLDHQGHADLLDLKVKRGIEERKGLQVQRD